MIKPRDWLAPIHDFRKKEIHGWRCVKCSTMVVERKDVGELYPPLNDVCLCKRCLAERPKPNHKLGGHHAE